MNGFPDFERQERHLRLGGRSSCTFGGSEVAEVPPGALGISDPIEIDVPPRGDIAVSFHVSAPTLVSTFPWDAEETGYVVAGNQVSSPMLKDAKKITTRIFLSQVLVEAPKGTRTVALGHLSKATTMKSAMRVPR